MEKWLDAPAGKHGFLKMKEKDLVFEDGTPVKFWGVNICSEKPFVDSGKVKEFVDMLSFNGINGVRFHKYTWNATDPNYSTIPDSDKFRKMDYFQASLKERGIYYGWSHIYGHKVRPADSSKLLAYNEIANLSYPWSHLNGTTSSLVNFAKDLQDLNIELTLNLLNRTNPYTGIKYANDPALAFVEFQNEDNIFWGAIERSLGQAPTYRALLCKKFSAWLKEKYGNDPNLRNAWGQALPKEESILSENVYPRPNHDIFTKVYNRSIEQNEKIPQDILDKMAFLYQTQMTYYKRFEKAVREIGYKGLIISSNWQAGSGFSHFYNLHTDYEIGPIDRHNYFGGGSGGHTLDTGIVKNKTMLSKPGSGLLGTGTQQVSNRPFFISEWMSLIPNQYTAESSPIVATYGMGLQGWDASFSFAVDFPHYSNTLQSPGGGVYNVTSPLQMGLYPALSTMIYRGDITEAPIVAEKNVHLPSLNKGQLGFVEKVYQGYDDKSFRGSVPPEVLAYGKAPIVFSSAYKKTDPFSLKWAGTQENKVITSITKELEWNYAHKGYITINTENTKGVIGFTDNKEIKLGQWKIQIKNDFSVVYLTNLDSNKGMDSCKRILITALGKARNKGMKYSQNGKKLIEKGGPPIEMEAIDFVLTSKRTDVAKLKVLDHMGRETEMELAMKNNEIRIEGSKHKTLYYLLEYGD